MELLDYLIVKHGEEEKRIELYYGDLTDLKPSEAVDLLILSAFPNDYSATPNSLIGALSRRGIAVNKLSYDKEIDLRNNFSCWLSKEIQDAPVGIEFSRILCFEPLYRGRPTEVVGEIFQSITSIINMNNAVSSIAMPLVATGDQGVPLADMLTALLDAAVHWLALGLPIKTLKIVQYSSSKAAETKGAFSILKRQYNNFSIPNPPRTFSYDLFLSYSRSNYDQVSFITDELTKLKPDINIFLDKKDINAGASWQQEIFNALDDCRKVITVYSPDYIASKVCKEEFNIALFRHRESASGILMPIYLHSTNLPTYMQLLNYLDCREGDKNKIQLACTTIVDLLKNT